MKPYELITFDLDDTLWEMRPVLVEADRRMRAWIDGEAPGTFNALDPETVMSIRRALVSADPALATDISALRVRVMEQGFQHHGIDPLRATVLAEQAFDIFMEARNDVTWFNDVVPMFEALQGRGLRLGGLSNGNADMHRTGLGSYFHFHLAAADVGANKPDPAMFERAFREQGVLPDQVLHVGDSIANDVHGALAAGCAAVWLDREVQSPRPPELPEDVAVIHSLAELPALLDG